MIYLHRQPYQFMLPDYMVHQPSKPKIQRGVPVCPPAPSGVPYRNPVIHESDGIYFDIAVVCIKSKEKYHHWISQIRLGLILV